MRCLNTPGKVITGATPISETVNMRDINECLLQSVQGSTTLFSALLRKCLEREKVVICRYTARKNTPPRFVALLPQVRR